MPSKEVILNVNCFSFHIAKKTEIARISKALREEFKNQLKGVFSAELLAEIAKKKAEMLIDRMHSSQSLVANADKDQNVEKSEDE